MTRSTSRLNLACPTLLVRATDCRRQLVSKVHSKCKANTIGAR